MQTGRIEANLAALHSEFKLSYLRDLLAQKISTAKQVAIRSPDFAFYRAEFERLRRELAPSAEHSHLPKTSDAPDRLKNLLIRIRTR